MFQQNISKYKITIAVLHSSSSKIEELKLFIPSFKAQAGNLQKSKAYLIEK